MNVKEFFQTPNKFTNYQPSNPAKSKEERIWDERDGTYIVQNYNLRRLCLGLILVVIVMAVGLIIQSTKNTVEPYFIEVNTTTGQVKNVGKIENVEYNPQEAEIKYFLTQFVCNTRNIPLDPVVYKKNWNNAYMFLTKNAAQKMNAEVQSENIAQYFGKKTVQVNILSVLPLEGGNSYQVRWNEEEFVIGNGDKQTIPMSGIFTVMILPVKDEATLQVNPLGIYISDFNWTKDSTATTKK